MRNSGLVNANQMHKGGCIQCLQRLLSILAGSIVASVTKCMTAMQPLQIAIFS